MRILKLFYLPALLAMAFFFHSCSDKTDVNVVRKLGIPMDGTQVVPAKPGAWNGTMDVEYNQDTRTLFYKVTWNSLSGAPISIGLFGTASMGYNALPNPTPNTAIQNFTSGFPSAAAGTFNGSVFVDGVVLKEEALYAGEYYVLVKTALNPGGEIRGQIVFQ